MLFATNNTKIFFSFFLQSFSTLVKHSTPNSMSRELIHQLCEKCFYRFLISSSHLISFPIVELHLKMDLNLHFKLNWSVNNHDEERGVRALQTEERKI